MEQQHPEERDVLIRRWKWDLFLNYIEAMEWLYVALADLDDRQMIQRDLRSTWLRVSSIVASLKPGESEQEGPSEKHETGEVAEPTGRELREVYEGTDHAQTTMYAAARRYCCDPSKGSSVNYYGSAAGAVTRCERLAQQLNCSCQVRTGRC
jgi:hypothetical protein